MSEKPASARRVLLPEKIRQRTTSVWRLSTSGSPRPNRSSVTRSRPACSTLWSSEPWISVGSARRDRRHRRRSRALGRDDRRPARASSAWSPRSASAMSGWFSASRCRAWRGRAGIGTSFWRFARCSIRSSRIPKGCMIPGHYNDRLLLGIEGDNVGSRTAYPEGADARRRDGQGAARRAWASRSPWAICGAPSGEIVLDPDEQAQATIRLVFDLYDRFAPSARCCAISPTTASGCRCAPPAATTRASSSGAAPNRPSLYSLLVNPIYAGAYVYGLRPTDRRRQRPGHPKTGRRAPRSRQRAVVLPDRLPAYISWDRYQANQARLRSNAAGERGPVRAGSALLSGLLDLWPLRPAHDVGLQQQWPRRPLPVRQHEVGL